MYCNFTNFPMGPNGGDWEVTEEYMREKDKEMARYVPYLADSLNVY